MSVEPPPSNTNANTSPPPAPSDTRAFERWRRNVAWATGIGLSAEDQQRRTQERDESLLRRCDATKRTLLERSPAIIFMRKHLQLAGCPVAPPHIECRACTPGTGAIFGGFDPATGHVLLCAGRFATRRAMEDTIVHELVHAYDHCRFRVDWRDLRHHACSEIRAASLSGDCRWGREITRFFFAFSKQHQACARRRAILSVAANPDCPSDAAAEQAVNEVWESCFKDTRPFDEIY